MCATCIVVCDCMRYGCVVIYNSVGEERLLRREGEGCCLRADLCIFGKTLALVKSQIGGVSTT